MLGIDHMTQTTLDAARRQVWSKELTRAFEAQLVLAKLVSRFDAESKGAKSVIIPGVSNLVAYDKVANNGVILQAPNETSITLNLNKHKHVAFVIEDAVMAQMTAPYMEEYAKKASYGIKRALDTDIANLATGFSQSAGTYNTTVSTTAVLTAVRLLDDADVPQEERAWVLKPKAVADLRTISDYTRYDGTGYAGAQADGSVGAKKSGQGLVGMLYNAPVYMSTQVLQSGNNISNLYIHKEAIALGIQREARVQSEYKLEYLGWLTVADTQYGVIERRDNAGIEFRS